MKETKVLVTFSAKAIKKIKVVQAQLEAQGKMKSKSIAANIIIENSK